MKVDSDGTTRVEFEVRFSPGRTRPRPRVKETAPPPLKPVPPQVSKLTQLLVLGYHFERLVRDRTLRDFKEVARLAGLSKARVTQIVNLTLLAPALQAEVLHLSNEDAERAGLHERDLRTVIETISWDTQARLYSAVRR